MSKRLQNPPQFENPTPFENTLYRWFFEVYRHITGIITSSQTISITEYQYHSDPPSMVNIKDTVYARAFDPNTPNHVYFQTPVPYQYLTNTNIQVYIKSNETTGVKWSLTVCPVVNNTPLNEYTVSGTAQQLSDLVIPGLKYGDVLSCKLTRNANDAQDTNTKPAVLFGVDFKILTNFAR